VNAGLRWTERLEERAGPTPPPSWRIALVCPYSLSRPGGVQGQVLGLARALEARGHRATVFAPVDDLARLPTGVEVVATGRSVPVRGNGSVAPISLSVTAARSALRILRSAGFDAIHVHEPFTPGLPYGLLVSRGLPPMVATFHRSGGSPFYKALRPLTRRLARRFAARCAVSAAAGSTASAALGGTYEIGFNGVEADEYHGVDPWPTDRPTVLFLGRHEERKGLGVLLEAFEALATTATANGGVPAMAARPVLWIAGDGPQTDTLRGTHPESPDIRWLGVIPDPEKARRLMAADLLCAPSLGGESFGMVLLEAMAARAVVVASDIDGYRDAAGGHALLVPPGDSRALVEAVSGVLCGSGAVDTRPGGEGGPGGDGSRRRWLDAAEGWAAHWSMGRLAEWYEGIYWSAVVGPPG
jgi:phosphatidylinositol alpha-mannosyltransferase